MTKKQSQVLIGIIAVAAIAIAVYFLMQKRKAAENVSTITDQSQLANTATEPTTTPVITNSSTASSKVRADLIAAYRKSGYLVQFVKCQSEPGQLAIKQGQKFMLDNAETTPHTFTIKSQAFKLGGYGYAIATARALGTYSINCDGVNRAQLLVQK